MLLGLTSCLYGSLCCLSFHVTWSHFRSAWVSMLSECICHLVTLPLGMAIDVVRFSMYLVTLPFCMGICISVFLWHLVSLSLCMGLYVVRLSMLLDLTSCLHGSLCFPSFYVTSVLYWSLCFRVSMLLGLTSVMYGSLCCSGFYVTWSHLRSVWVYMLSQFLCHLVSLPLSMVFYVVTGSMSLDLTSVLYGSICFASIYVTWSHLCYIWVSMLSEFLCYLDSLSSVWISMLSEFLCHLVSLPLCMVLYVFQVSMSLNFTSVLYVLLCCPSFQVTCSHFRFVWFSMLSEFLYWFSFIFMFVIGLIIMADRSFLAHLAKGNVSICHHLASVVR